MNAQKILELVPVGLPSPRVPAEQLAQGPVPTQPHGQNSWAASNWLEERTM